MITTNIIHALSITFSLQQMSMENLEVANWTQQSHKIEGDWIHEQTLGTKLPPNSNTHLGFTQGRTWPIFLGIPDR